MSTSTARLPHGGKEPVATKLVIVVVSLAILTFLAILSEASLNIAYSTLMEEFSISASVVQWLTTGYLLLPPVSIPSSPFMVRKSPRRPCSSWRSRSSPPARCWERSPCCPARCSAPCRPRWSAAC